MTRLLIAAGCHGDDGHVQRLDTEIPRMRDIGDAPGIAWRRSLPHDKRWPDIGQMLLRLDVAGYTPMVLVMSRDWHAMIASQLAAPHAPDGMTATANIRHAYHQIFRDLAELDLPYEVVNYESLVMRPHATVRALLARLGLPAPDALPPIHDGNAKHYAGITDLATGDREQMRADIEAKYGFTPPAEYVTDLMALVDALAAHEVVL
jgi:hypothetical protein